MIKINTTPEIKALNDAVEAFDWLTNYKFDRSPLPILEMEAKTMIDKTSPRNVASLSKMARIFRQNIPKRVFVNQCIEPQDLK